MSGETLFRRKCKLLVAAPIAQDFQTISANVTEIEDLRVSFKITKSLTKDPNSAEIKVYNLNAQTRAALGSLGSKIVLSAGYVDTVAQLFIGDARLIEHRREGTDWVTKIECGDSAAAIKFGRISESFKSGTDTGKAIKKIAALAKINIGNIDSVAGRVSGQLTQGLAVHGIAYVELEKLLRNAGFSLSVQDGALLALGPNDTSTETTIVLNANSGLIGSPEMGTANVATKPATKKAVLKVKSLLQPELKPGRRVRVEIRSYTGDFRCAKVEHDGDTNGSNWFSDLELEAL